MIRLGLTDADASLRYSASDDEHVVTTTDLSSSNIGDVNVFSSTCINVADIFYVGHSYNRFGRFSACVSTESAASPTVIWEYYNSGAAGWKSIFSDTTINFKEKGKQETLLTGSTYELWRHAWGKTSVCDVEAYYLRARVLSVDGGGSGATITSGSVDIALTNPLPRMDQQLFAALHQAMAGNRTLDVNAVKRKYTFVWTALDQDDAISVRERVEFTKSACTVLPAEWGEDKSDMEMVIDITAPPIDQYRAPGLHDITLALLEA